MFFHKVTDFHFELQFVTGAQIGFVVSVFLSGLGKDRKALGESIGLERLVPHLVVSHQEFTPLFDCDKLGDVEMLVDLAPSGFLVLVEAPDAIFAEPLLVVVGALVLVLLFSDSLHLVLRDYTKFLFAVGILASLAISAAALLHPAVAHLTLELEIRVVVRVLLLGPLVQF